MRARARALIKRSIDVSHEDIFSFLLKWLFRKKKRKRKQCHFLLEMSLCLLHRSPRDFSLLRASIPFPFFFSYYRLPLSIFRLPGTIRGVGDDIYDKAILRGYVGAVKGRRYAQGLF